MVDSFPAALWHKGLLVHLQRVISIAADCEDDTCCAGEQPAGLPRLIVLF
jgi:phosphoribosyl-AMP cyclohydrolase